MRAGGLRWAQGTRGGKAQRVKLAAHLAAASCEETLFIFDEPTTGLHFEDIAQLLDAFQKLIQSGASVLIIEHNIDLGRRAGDKGGEVVVAGTPEQVARCERSYTGRYLRGLVGAGR